MDTKPKLPTPEELAEMRENVRFAVTNLALDGIHVTEEELSIIDDLLVRGVSLEEGRDIINKWLAEKAGK